MTPGFIKSLKRWLVSDFKHDNHDQSLHDEKIIYNVSGHERSWILNGFFILGTVVISIGVIAQIAAYWNVIPDWLKFMSSALGLMILIGAAWIYKEKNPLIFEGALLFLLALCLGIITLIAQFYHATSPFYPLLLVWCFLTVGVAYFAQYLLAPGIWAGALLGSFSLTLYQAPLFSRIQPAFMEFPELLGIILFFLCGSTALVNTPWFNKSALKRALKVWTLIVGLSVLALFELNSDHSHSTRFFIEFSAAILHASLVLYALAMITFLMLIFSEEYTKSQKVVVCLILLGFLAIAHIAILSTSPFWYAPFTIIALMLMAIFLASTASKQLFILLLFLVGLRFLAVYFQTLGNLTLTASGIMLSGLTIIGGTFFWQKYRHLIIPKSHETVIA